MPAKNHSNDLRALDRERAVDANVNRRDVLRQMMSAGALAGVPWNQVPGQIAPVPPQELLIADPEAYWSRIRHEQFLLDDARIFLNPGSLGVMPRPVLQAVADSLTSGAVRATDEVPRWGFEKLEPERTEMAEFLGCRADELAFTHNCTEALSIIANGLDLNSGDEVLMTNQEHGSGYACWQLKAARYGTTIRQVEIPVTPTHPEELADRLISAIGPKTRVLSFSGITSPTGLNLPVQRICHAAREKGVITVVDGAHMCGQIPVNLHELGCDYFAGSPHKWLFSPPGCGFLYGRDDSLDRLWPCVVAIGWDNKAEWRAARFMLVGTNNRALIDGMLAGVRFLKGLGEKVVYQRIHSLAELALREAQRRDYLDLITSDNSRLYQAMVTVRFKTDKLAPLWAAMQASNACVLQYQPMRLSMHIHTRPADIQSFFAICDRVLAG